MNSALKIIVAREYLERVKRKSFIISTILMPLFMVAMMALPTVLLLVSGPEECKIGVIDDSGKIAQTLEGGDEISFVSITDQTFEQAKDNSEFDAFLVIGPDVVANPNASITFYTQGAPSIQTEQFVASQIENTIETIRINNSGVENLRDIMQSVKVDVEMKTFRLDQEEETATSSMLSYAMGFLATFILYMFIMLYGNMVMNSIIEEKNNRVLELVVTSVNPTWLMMGKIIGVGLVALTQMLVWAGIIMICSAWVLPMLTAMASGADGSMMAAMSQLTDVGFMGQYLLYLILFLVGGYFFYASIYAAIGSAVDNLQDASQLQTVAVLPIILAFVISMTVVNDPNSTLAMWTSFIPFTSPMVMMARMPFGIDGWQMAVSIVVLYAGFVGMVWVAAKIYRVGIFMYGKKPTFGDLMRWVRYK
ncbi:MAG: ABC transporter permease [Muribaculaceae bacterium]